MKRNFAMTYLSCLLGVMSLFPILKIAHAEDPQFNCAALESSIKDGKLGKVLSDLQTSQERYQIEYAKIIGKLIPSKVGDYEEFKRSFSDQPLSQQNSQVDVMSMGWHRYRKAGAPEIILHIKSKASGPHSGAWCFPNYATPGQKVFKLGAKDIMIRDSAREKFALICLEDISLQLDGTSVTEEQYMQFAKNLGESFLKRLEDEVAKME